ncbi:glycosyltransferase [Pectobacterium carotovorum]|uniref:glycosyltransferase n=1 Tax=Pectobacterium carotovorum TaxID=554 RepID=UPI001E47B467|nr:glycosyltransferase [Pectobacterium carotovorum]UFT95768.1 glycosyltransferase family 4 protein [Pectobacterium carotovorum]
MNKINHNDVIFISMYLPEPNIPEAGQKLAYHRLNGMMLAGSRVHLVSFANEKELTYLNNERFKDCASVNLIKINNARRLINIIKKPLLPVCIGIRADSVMKKIIENILNDVPNVKIHVEYEQGIQNIPSYMYDKTTLVVHDVISQSIERGFENAKGVMSKFFYYTQLTLIKRWEKKLKGLGKIIVLNSKDKELLDINVNVDRGKISIDYPIVDKFFSEIDRRNIEKGSILFWGAMNRKENEDAVIWFVNEIFPLIKKEINNAKLYVVGTSPSETIKSLACESIIVTGFVESPKIFFEKAQVAIVPLRYGAGIKIKVIEALAAKIPVVSTSVGAEGIIDSDDLLYVADDVRLLSQETIRLLKYENINF